MLFTFCRTRHCYNYNLGIPTTFYSVRRVIAMSCNTLKWVLKWLEKTYKEVKKEKYYTDHYYLDNKETLVLEIWWNNKRTSRSDSKTVIFIKKSRNALNFFWLTICFSEILALCRICSYTPLFIYLANSYWALIVPSIVWNVRDVLVNEIDVVSDHTKSAGG